MPRYIALLRGINVGGHRVRMDRLRSLFEELGFADVATVIASGNVLFTAEGSDRGTLRGRIEGHLEQALGYEVETFLRTPAQLATLAHGSTPNATEDPSASSHYVIFLHGPPPESLKSALDALASDMDKFRFTDGEIHWHIRGRLSESPLFDGGLNRALRTTPTTMRNMKTIRRIVARG